MGRAIALELASRGYDVLLHANSSLDEAWKTHAAVQERGVASWVIEGDLSTIAGVTQIAERAKEKSAHLDLLVHNAAAYEHARLEDVTPDAFDRMMHVNARAPLFLTQALLPALRASSEACIVAITDAATVRPYSALHAFSHYLASKAALEQLTRSWALELAPAIRVNAVAPGPVAIGVETSDAERRALLERTPLRREGSVEDVARAVGFLAQAPYITGQVLAVDGGLGVS